MSSFARRLRPLDSLASGNNRPGPQRGDRLGVPIERMIDRCDVYVDGVNLPGHYTYDTALKEVRSRGEGFVWLAIHGPDSAQMARIAKAYGLHELTLEDVITAHQRPKLERYDDQLFLVVRQVKYMDHETVTDANEIIETAEIQMVVGADFIITVRHGDLSDVRPVRRRLEADPLILARGPMSVAHAIADSVVDHYLEVAQELEKDIAEMEEQVFTPRSMVDIEQIYMLKREVLEMLHTVEPLGVALRALVTDHKDLVSKQQRNYFRDVLDHQIVANDRVGNFDDMLSSLIQAAAAKISVQQNTDMRKISAWVAVAALPTMIAGIYGMNFENMPELGMRYGYYYVLAFIALACTILLVIFRRNKWL